MVSSTADEPLTTVTANWRKVRFMRRMGKIYSTALVFASLLILLAAWSGLAWADSQEHSTKTSDQKAADDRGAGASTTSYIIKPDDPGFKGFAISLGRADDDKLLHLKTAVLVKPLRTDQFFVAFAASAPLINTNGASAAERYGAGLSLGGPQGLRQFHTGESTGSGSDWLVMADWPKTSRLLPVDRETDFHGLPVMSDSSGWHSKMELIFLPADQWTVRAILSMAQDAPEYRQFLASDDAHSARIGMAIDVDYQIFKTIALGFDYGHYRYGRTFRAATGDAEVSPNTSNLDGPIRTDTFTARLTIRF